MSWGISENATPKEKLKSEMADYLHGLNSTGTISYEIYSKAFDFSMNLLDKMYELGKKEKKMFTREEKAILLEAIRTKTQKALGDLKNTNNDEIKAKKEKRIELLLSCRTKISSSKDIKQ